MKIKTKNNLWKYDDFVIKTGTEPGYCMITILEFNDQVYRELTSKGIDLNKTARFVHSSSKYESYINPMSGWDNLFLHKSIRNRNEFMDNILGYNDNGYGTFPFVNTIDDAIELINAAIKTILQYE